MQLPGVRLAELHELIRALAKATPPPDADYRNTEAALALMDKTVASVQALVQSTKNRKLMLELESKFVVNPGFMAPGRGTAGTICNRSVCDVR